MPVNIRAIRICSHLLVLGVVLLFVLPLLIESVADVGREAGISLLIGVIVGLPSSMVVILAYRIGHWFNRWCWLVAGALVGALSLIAGLAITEDYWDEELLVQAMVGTVAAGSVLIGLRRALQRRTSLYLGLPDEAELDFGQFSLFKLLLGTTLLAVLFAVVGVVARPSELELIEIGDESAGVFAAELGMATLAITVCCINCIICIYWAFASKEIVVNFVVFGALYAVAVSMSELALVALVMRDDDPLEVWGFAAAATLAQTTVVMACLLYLRWRGFRLIKVDNCEGELEPIGVDDGGE